MKRKNNESIAGYLFILPSLIGVTVGIAFAVFFTLIISFTNWDMVSWDKIKFIGMRNYIDLITDKVFLISLYNNLYFIMFIPIGMFIGLIFSIILNNKIIGARVLRTVYYLPNIVNGVAVFLVWSILLNPTDGVINRILMSIGVDNPPGWFSSSKWVKLAIVLMILWADIGWCIVYFTAALQGVPKHLYESAEIDGATGIKKFFHITFPMISPITFYILIMEIISSFKMWSGIQMISQGGPGISSTVSGYFIYKEAFLNYRLGYSSAASVILLAIILIITLIQWFGQKKWVNYT